LADQDREMILQVPKYISAGSKGSIKKWLLHRISSVVSKK